MSWFVDASVVVALSIREDDWERYSALMDWDRVRLWSPLVRWQSVAATRKRFGRSAEEAATIVRRVADENDFLLVPIGEGESDAAQDAYARYGRRSGSRANLNMGDCFAYACAKTNDARLLYKGDDFSHTDLAL